MMPYYETYTADNEEPNCLECSHVCGQFDCDGQCGPEHGWAGYLREKKEALACRQAVRS